MKRFAIGAAAIAILAMSAPLSAQQVPAPATPAPSTAAPAQEMNRMPAGGKATSERGQTGSVTRAHHRRHTARSTKSKHVSTSAAQTPSPAANPTTTNRMPAGGGATSGTNKQ